jgi:hypothetical protein
LRSKALKNGKKIQELGSLRALEEKSSGATTDDKKTQETNPLPKAPKKPPIFIASYWAAPPLPSKKIKIKN